jgi:hypothetical protein
MILHLLLSADAVGGGGACACACACARVVSNTAVAGAAAPENVALSAGLHCTPYKAAVSRLQDAKLLRQRKRKRIWERRCRFTIE